MFSSQNHFRFALPILSNAIITIWSVLILGLGIGGIYVGISLCEISYNYNLQQEFAFLK